MFKWLSNLFGSGIEQSKVDAEQIKKTIDENTVTQADINKALAKAPADVKATIKAAAPKAAHKAKAPKAAPKAKAPKAAPKAKAPKAAPKAPAVNNDAAPTSASLSKLTKGQLEDLGKKFGIDIDRRKKKEALVVEVLNASKK